MPAASSSSPPSWSADSLKQVFAAHSSEPMQEKSENGMTYLIGNLWTARQRQGHSIHEISYRACFKPQLPELLISLLSAENDRVLDPFMGRGTTVIQAALMNRIACGSDVNPLSAMLTAPRLATPTLKAVATRLAEIPLTSEVPTDDTPLLTFFHPQVLQHLVALKNWFAQRTHSKQLDGVDEWIRMVAINRLTGHSTGFFSVHTMPPNQAVSIKTQQHLNQVHQRVPLAKDVNALILKKSRSLLRSGHVANRRFQLACAPAERLSYLKANRVQLIVTSPPFLDMVDYHKDNWLRCWFAALEQETIKIDQHRNIADWQAFVRRTFSEFARVLQSGGMVAFEVGEARNGKLLLEQLVAEAVRGLPFTLLAVLVNQQQFTKTANCWGVNNNEKGTNSNRIVLLQKQ
ncbi:MAG: site-specific DNA-methyltransferase [Proteobacteria bacterium]|nr:site-specific DNA-methyltransferase [Pseudomonadota bacterium]